MNFKRFFIFLPICFLKIVGCEEFSSGAEYLQTAIRDIVIKNSERNILDLFENQPRIIKPTKKIIRYRNSNFDGHRRLSGGDFQTYHQYPPIPPTADIPPTTPDPSQVPQNIPQHPSLTKGELAALYEAAVSAGNTVQLSGLSDTLPAQAVAHEIKDNTDSQNGDSYYYYYYPLKSFLDGIPANILKPAEVPKDHYKTPILTSYNTHLHNVKVESVQSPTEAPAKGSKALEPLFMAISSFIGMALMFMFSMILLPRLTAGINKGPKGKGKNNIKKKGRLFPTSTSFPNFSWIQIVSKLMHACPNCTEQDLSPFRGFMNRIPKVESKK